MKRRIFTFILIAIIAIFTKGHSMQLLTKKLFNMDLADLIGNDVEMDTYTKGNKYTVITFFTSGCMACQSELKTINENTEKWKTNYGAKFVAVSLDKRSTIGNIKTMSENQKWQFTTLWDYRMQAASMLNIHAVPYTIIVNENGYIVSENTGWGSGSIHSIENMLATK